MRTHPSSTVLRTKHHRGDRQTDDDRHLESDDEHVKDRSVETSMTLSPSVPPERVQSPASLWSRRMGDLRGVQRPGCHGRLNAAANSTWTARPISTGFPRRPRCLPFSRERLPQDSGSPHQPWGAQKRWRPPRIASAASHSATIRNHSEANMKLRKSDSEPVDGSKSSGIDASSVVGTGVDPVTGITADRRWSALIRPVSRSYLQAGLVCGRSRPRSSIDAEPSSNLQFVIYIAFA